MTSNLAPPRRAATLTQLEFLQCVIGIHVLKFGTVLEGPEYLTRHVQISPGTCYIIRHLGERLLKRFKRALDA